MLDLKDIRIEHINSSGGSIMRLVHVPTGIFRIARPLEGRNQVQLRDHFLKEVEWELTSRIFPPPLALERLDRAIRERRPVYAFALNRGASEEQLAEAEAGLQRPLPDDLKHFFRWRNGQQRGASFCNAYKLMDLNVVAELWRRLSEFHDGGGFDHSDWWSSGWIPFLTRKNRDFLCLDLNGTFSAKPGQIIEFRHDSPDRTVLFPNFSVFLSTVADFLEKATFEDENESLIIPDDFISVRHPGFPRRFQAGPPT